MTGAEAQAAAEWTSVLRNQLAARYPEAAEYTIEINGKRARLLDADGRELGSWRSYRNFFDGLLMTLDPTTKPRGTKAFFGEILEAVKDFFGEIMSLPCQIGAALKQIRR